MPHLSSVEANMYLPLGENFTKDTGGLSSSKKIKNRKTSSNSRSKKRLQERRKNEQNPELDFAQVASVYT